MTGNANVIALHGHLRECGLLRSVALKWYNGEYHGSVIACGLSRNLTTFFEEWPHLRINEAKAIKYLLVDVLGIGELGRLVRS
jgi:hypothetical protein